MHKHPKPPSPSDEQLCRIECALQDLTLAVNLLTLQGDRIMGTLEDLRAAIDAEHAEVQSKLADLATQIQALKDQLANGTPVTAEQFDALIASVQSISEPV